MDRYKKAKPKSQYSVDGFLVTGPRKRYQETTSQQKATPQSPRLNQLDNFDRSDGFHGNKHLE